MIYALLTEGADDKEISRFDNELLQPVDRATVDAERRALAELNAARRAGGGGRGSAG